MNKSIRGMTGKRISSAVLFFGVIIDGFFGASSGYAKTVALWDFNDGTIGTDVVSATDSISGLTAIPATKNTSAPQYVAGKDNGSAVKFGTGSILEVTDNSGIMGAGFRELCVSFDVDLAADVSSGTQVLLRNGHQKASFNIFLQANNVIGVILQGSDGTPSSTIKTASSALSTSADWQNVMVIWNGAELSIYIDGVAQRLNVGGTSAKIPGISSLIKSDAPMGIGGLRRVDGSTSQYLNGAIDNIIIYSKVPGTS